MKGACKRIARRIRDAYRFVDHLHRAKATERLEWETRELENIFSLLTIGAFVGMQAPPMHISLDLLPYMEDELACMTSRVCMANDPLADLFSMLDGM